MDPEQEGSPPTLSAPEGTSLPRAVMTDNVAELKKCLKESKWKQRLSEAAMYAAKHCKWNSLNALLDHGVPINRYNKKNRSLLHVLMMYEAKKHPRQVLELTKRILERARDQGINLQTFLNKKWKNNDGTEGHTALHCAVLAKHVECARALLEAGADPNNSSGFSQVTPLMDAANRGSHQLVDLLLANGAKVNKCSKSRDTALIHAVLGKQHVCVVRLLSDGAEVNHVNHSGLSAVMHAAQLGQMETTRVLLEHGASATQRDIFGRSGLHYAAKSRSYQVLELFLNALPQLPDDMSIVTAVMEADDHVMLEMLVRRGLALKRNDKKTKINALHMAAETGSLSCLKYLLDNKEKLSLDVNLRNTLQGQTPLHRACAYGQDAAVDMLLAHGADPNKVSCSKYTPLFYCMEVLSLLLTSSRALNCIRSLLRFGCEYDKPCVVHLRGLQGKHSMTPLDYAVCGRNLFMAHMLAAAGCRSVALLCSVAPPNAVSLLPQEYHCQEEEKTEFLRELQTPPTLYAAARTSVRRAMATNIHTKVARLPLPENVKEYLDIPELDDYVEAFNKGLEYRSEEEEDYLETPSEDRSDGISLDSDTDEELLLEAEEEGEGEDDGGGGGEAGDGALGEGRDPGHPSSGGDSGARGGSAQAAPSMEYAQARDEAGGDGDDEEEGEGEEGDEGDGKGYGDDYYDSEEDDDWEGYESKSDSDDSDATDGEDDL